MSITTSRVFSIFIVVGFFLILESTAQMGREPARGRGPGMMGAPFYNLATEVTINGTVDDVRQMSTTGAAGKAWRCPRGWTGTHLMLKTDTGALAVHVGPSAYLASKNFSIAKGDKLTILGSRVQYQGSDFLVAKEITKGNEVLTLRNSAGFPMWSGFRMGSTPLPTTPSGK
jgi:hypothetical protein